ncbi:MAG: hypothetical protein PHV34_16555 [Verrucomicrobiae bacterium]|nr:hypothetical protein [Verrucomicrobiae bacterium]
MNDMPPDWNEDRRLWEVLRKMPRAKPPSNFNWMVRQKLAREQAPDEVISKPESGYSWIFHHWVRIAVPAAACAVILLMGLYLNMGRTANGGEGVEFCLMAQHVEMLQDLEVIENLDQLL